MGLNQSKEELLYHQVSYGNIEGIRSLYSEGAGLEWIDKEGKTPLIVACMKPDYMHVAKTLIELGANINAYRPGSHAGTPLHHAAKRGLEQTVKLLLSHGANATVMNDDCQNPLDLARAKGHVNVVRAIEVHICHFSGWLRELNLPGFLGALVPQWVSKRIWAVVIPCGSRNPRMPNKFELVIYSGLEMAQPRTVIQLWKSKIEEPNFNHSDPALVIVDKSTKTKFKFLSANEGDKQQLHWFYSACIGMVQPNVPTPVPARAPVSFEDSDLTMAMNASLQQARQERPLGSEVSGTNGWGSSTADVDHHGWTPEAPSPPSKLSSSSGWMDEPASGSNAYNGWDVPEVQPNDSLAQSAQGGQPTAVPTPHVPPPVEATPSAPPVPDNIQFDGPVHYPTIDSSPIDLAMPPEETKQVGGEEDTDDSSAWCVICLDAPKEGACVPCGHVVGCMSCLNDIKAKGWGCPVCRTKISQVIKLYTV
ncbi:probable E3 ubiquitin-protein ligase XBOS34 isoform X2 [Aristolochia californica]|uniref:probable E3 ubiquitin-protein ligase XBOS34 isoform X2 n=2 Tax=Aristolochia californica TaxID=171875 RepID=UPI0035D97D8B